MILTFDEYAPVFFRPNSQPVPKKLLKKMEDKIVRFNYERWVERNMFKWDTEQLALNDNSKTQILKDIQNIRFPNLKKLDLRWNHIESIDQLSNIEMPQIQCLYIKHNHITIIAPLRKLYSPNLSKLFLENNQIRDLQRLHEMKMGTETQIQLDGNYIYRLQGISLNHFVKYESIDLKLSHIINERIQHTKEMHRLSRRYKKYPQWNNKDNEQW